jgi:CheY-like chemotaxis protein
MPIMDGWMFRSHQLADPELASVPVIAVSAICDQTDEMRRLGVPCLRMPVDFGALFIHVAAACGRAAK